MKILQRAPDPSAPLLIAFHCGPQFVDAIPPSWGLASILLPSYAGSASLTEIDAARAATGTQGPLVLVGWSAGCGRVRELLRAGADVAAVVALDGISGDVPPTAAQMAPWREVCAKARTGHACAVLTCTEQVYTSVDLPPGERFMPTLDTCSALWLERDPAAVTRLSPERSPYEAGRLRIEVHASQRYDGPAHLREANEHGPRILRDLVVPHVEASGKPVDVPPLSDTLPVVLSSPVVQRPPPEPSEGIETRGIDVSHHQGVIDWTEVAASGVQFAFVKVSDGLHFRDPLGASNLSGARLAGVRVGAYHYLRLGDGAEQADAFLAAYARAPNDLPPVLDLEDDVLASAAPRIALAWLRKVEERIGVRPIVYTFPGFARWIAKAPELAAYPLWIAHWGVASPIVPAPWKAWTIWQHSRKGRVPGIRGDVDLNRARGI